jgi:hypothetical protein
VNALRQIYEELVRLCGPMVCPVEDWHVSRWRIVWDPVTHRLELVARRDLTEERRPE